MRIIKFIFQYIFQLIISNPAKSVCMGLFVICIGVVKNSNKEVEKIEVINSFEHNEKYVYTYLSGDEYENRTFDGEKVISEDGFIEVSVLSGTSIFCTFSAS